jgi:hypothetical protein
MSPRIDRFAHRPEKYRHPKYASIPDSILLVDHDILKRPKPVVVPRVYTDWTRFWEGGHHTLLQGRTGSGKTTLLLNLLWMLYLRGHRVLLRDDGGLDFLYLAEQIPMTIWVPDGCTFTLQHPELYDIETQSFKEAHEILDEVYASPYRFHAILYDVYCSDPGPAARFYSDMFRQLIFKCMQTEHYKKTPLVFSFDEINDLIQPKGYELTRDHTTVRSLIEYNVRKLRKHRVTLIATTHRFNQISVNVRSQFSYIMIKQCYGKDVYDFISHNLITAANEAFWSILRDITTMSYEYVYVFDYKNSYDRIRTPDIPRPTVRYSLTGEIVEEEEDTRKYDEIDLLILAGRMKTPPDSYTVLAHRVSRARSTIQQRIRKLKQIPELEEVMK